MPRSAPVRPFAVAVLGLALTAGVTACGSSGGSGGSGSGTAAQAAVLTPTMENGVQVFALTGTAGLMFSAKELDAKPGKIRVDLTVAAQSAPHDFVVDGVAGARTAIIDAGSSGSTTFTVAKPGTYGFACTIHPNMTGILKVT